MNIAGRLRNINPIRAGFYFLLFLVSTYVMAYALGKSDILRDGPHHTTAILLIDGFAVRPYIYRALVPALSHFADLVTPGFLQDMISGTALAIINNDLVVAFMDIAKWEDYSPTLATPDYLYPATIIVLLMYGSLIAYGVVLHRISTLCFPAHNRTNYATAIFGLVILLPFIDRYFKVYDPSALLLSALCLLFMMQKRWAAYLIAFVFTCLNKETSILQTMLFAVAFAGRMPRQQFIKLVFYQLAIFALIKGGIDFFYFDSPGNLVKYREIWVLAKVSRRIDGHSMAMFAIICWFIFARWNEIPHILRASLSIAGGCAVVYYLLGVPYEYRVFFDCFPGLTVIAGYTLFKHLNAPPAAAPSSY